MRSPKKIAVVALILAALIIPVIAISENASGVSELHDDSIWVSGGFNDRSDGTITVRVHNGIEGEQFTVTLKNSMTGETYPNATRTVTVTSDDEDRGYIDVSFSFRIGSPGKYFVSVKITGDVNSSKSELNTYSFEVGRSIWSSIWTYVAIIVVIIIIAIVILLRMRAAPKVDSGGAFTAMEEERQVKRKSSGGAKKEEYKGRQKK